MTLTILILRNFFNSATYADMMIKGGTNDLAVCLNDLGDNIENDVANKMVMDVHAKLSSMNQLELSSACPNLALVALNRLTVSNKDKLMHYFSFINFSK